METPPLEPTESQCRHERIPLREGLRENGPSGRLGASAVFPQVDQLLQRTLPRYSLVSRVAALLQTRRPASPLLLLAGLETKLSSRPLRATSCRSEPDQTNL